MTQTTFFIYKKRPLLRCIHYFKSDLINNMDRMWYWTLVSDPCIRRCQCQPRQFLQQKFILNVPIYGVYAFLWTIAVEGVHCWLLIWSLVLRSKKGNSRPAESCIKVRVLYPELRIFLNFCWAIFVGRLEGFNNVFLKLIVKYEDDVHIHIHWLGLGATLVFDLLTSNSEMSTFGFVGVSAFNFKCSK